MEVIPASEHSKATYRIFVEEEQDFPIYMKDWYLDAVCKSGKWAVILVKTKEGLIASFVYFLKRKLNFNYVTMPIFVKWMGLYVIPKHRNIKTEQKILEQILPLLSNLDAFKQNLHPNLINWSPLYWQGYKQTSFYTYQLNLSRPLEEILNTCNRNIRRNIKKATISLSIKSELSPEKFYAVNKMSFDRQSVHIPYNLSLFLQHDKALKEKKCRQIFYAIDSEDNIHAVSYLIWDKNVCYYHLSGENPSFRKSGASILLIWKAIEYAKVELKVNLFDFEGSMMPNVAHIRQQFGAIPITYHFVWKYNNLLYQLLERLKRF